PAAHWADGVLAELAALPHVRLLPRTTVFGRFEAAEYGAVERVSDHLPVPLPGQLRQRLWKIRAGRTIMATGATERPIVFDGNDRPGIMLAGAVSAYVHRYGVLPGKRAVLVIAADSGWEVAGDLLDAGVAIAAVIDLRGALPAALAERLKASGTAVIEGGAVIAAHGGSAVSGITLADACGRAQRFTCDLVAMAGGWNPNLALAAHLGERPVWDDALAAYLPGPSGELIPAGAAAGRFGLASALASGAEALRAALGREVALPFAADAPHGQAAIWQSGPCKGKAFVDFQHDVTAKDIALAAREGFTSVEHAKRYTTLGMATDQGRIGQVNGHGLLGAATGRSMAEVGTIRPRPPVTPVAIAAFAAHHRGAHFRPIRRTPSHDWAAAQGAVFIDAGQWKRAQWFPLPGETHWRTSVDREVKAVRGGVGLCDVSTLGKIELTGPDAGLLLDRLYINTMSSLRMGRARYGVMLREDGGVLDDGTVTRFGEYRWFLTTTTANAARVMQHLDFARQAIWPDLDVQAASVTEQWATYAVAGPLARDLLSAAFPDTDLSNAAVPYIAASTLRWEGRLIRLYRLSFSGELAYEVAIAAQHGAALLIHLAGAGADFGMVPYGTEALGVMRIEKGHAAGGELNGTVTAADLGMARMMSSTKDFIGKKMALRPGMADPARPRLVGLKPADGKSAIRAGAHLVRRGAAPVIANDEGYVTSACFSPILGHPIALALLANGAQRHGETVTVHDPVRGADVMAQVCDPVFYDPEGARLRG
ncbi:glycine cleavage T C-terminal barrel domain-containing protein, partial [Novosphingobium sp. Chol11]|uniref:glycine cleavage T C-terminal barrel domain-containing protein n=1 Tax=Novosphingobium sp. Chol11 TaxID=1385763 RepID=UPI0025F66B2B